MKKYLAIDPGKNGYICLMYDGKISYYAIPLIADQVDLYGLNMIFASFAYLAGDIKCVLEDVHALFGSSAKATFNFGWNVGMLEAMLVCNDIPYTKVTPKNWQKQMHEGIPKITKQGKTSTDTKAMSLMAAKRLFPNEDLRATARCTKAHDGKIDALLLCEYCRRNF